MVRLSVTPRVASTLVKGLVLGLALLPLAHCSRVEEPRPAAPEEPRRSIGAAALSVAPIVAAPSSPSSASAVPPAQVPAASDGLGVSPAAPATHCVHPLADPSPPVALPAARCPRDTERAPVLPRGRVTFLDAPSAPSIDVELARDPAHRTRGLMYRTAMGRDRGMLFSWSEDEIRHFWMHNTCIPLDMLFLGAEGTILGILEQVPTLNDDSRSIPCPARHVLEVNAGWSRAHGVKPGQKLQIEG